MQLAGPTVRIMANTRGMTEVKVYDPAAVEERFGVAPRLIPDLIGLKGDSSDNIPGVPGIGEKTAAQLLAQFGGLDEVLAHAGEVAGAKRRELLREHRDIALLSKKLALLDRDAPIDIHAAEVLPHELQLDKLDELFTRFEFTTLLARVRPLLRRPESQASWPAGSALPASRPAPVAAGQPRPAAPRSRRVPACGWPRLDPRPLRMRTTRSPSWRCRMRRRARPCFVHFWAGESRSATISSPPPPCTAFSRRPVTTPTSPPTCWLRGGGSIGSRIWPKKLG
jgi:hypothetical protein